MPTTLGGEVATPTNGLCPVCGRENGLGPHLPSCVRKSLSTDDRFAVQATSKNNSDWAFEVLVNDKPVYRSDRTVKDPDKAQELGQAWVHDKFAVPLGAGAEKAVPAKRNGKPKTTDETLLAVLDTLAPNGFRAAAAPKITAWLESTRELLKEANR